MVIMPPASARVFQLDEWKLYAEDDGWRCELEDGSTVGLGIVFEAVDLSGSPGYEEEEYSVVVEAAIVPRPEDLDDDVVLEVSQEEDPSREGLILDLYRHWGGVPVNIDALQPARASCGASSLVVEQNLRSRMTGPGTMIEVRHFRSIDEALRFTREFYVFMAPIVFEFLDWILDQPLGMGTGRDKIRALSKGG
jgi:hypothetical protein